MTALPPFASPAQVEAYSQGRITESDPRLAGALAGASEAIRLYCGWHIYPDVEMTLTLDGPGGYVLDLPSKNVTAVTTITEDTTELVADDDFSWSRIGTVKRAGCAWGSGYRSIEVTLTHGYESVPDVAQVLLAVVSRGLMSPTGAIREQTLSSSVTWSTVQGVAGGVGFAPFELAALDPYRIVSV